MLREDVLPHTKTLPDDFVAKVMHILNKGSIHSAASSSFIGELIWLAASPTRTCYCVVHERMFTLLRRKPSAG